MRTKPPITSYQSHLSHQKSHWLIKVIGIFSWILILIVQPNTAYANETATNRMIVKFKKVPMQTKSALSHQELSSLSKAAKRTITHLRPASGQQQILLLPEAISLSKAYELAETLTQMDTIEAAEPDLKRYPQLVPNDSDYLNQWYLFEEAGGINTETAWDITTGDNGTVIAVLDTGITVHPDLTGRTLPGYDFITDPNTASDGDGRDNDPSDPGDFITSAESNAVGGPFEGCPVTDSSWHGTVIAGILAANTNNTDGIAGINHAANILPIRVLGKCGGFASDVADAIRWAVGIDDPALPAVNPNPAKILNLSFGALSPCTSTEQSAINDAIAANATVITAAGNLNTMAEEFSPGNCEQVINVASSTRQGGETAYTNFGSAITLSAPGGNDAGGIDGIYSTSNSGASVAVNDNFSFVIGTSFSAPMVSGAISLMHAVRDGLSPTDILFILQTTARQFPINTSDSVRDCNASNCGAGLLDTNSAIIAARDNVLGGSGNGLIRMTAENACITEDDGQVNISAVRIGGTGDVSVRAQTQRISATANIDYTEINEVLTWGDGDTSLKMLSIAIARDTIVEGSEFFRVRLIGTSANAMIDTPDSTTVTIVSTNGNTPKSCSSPNPSGGGGQGLWLIALVFATLTTQFVLFKRI